MTTTWKSHYDHLNLPVEWENISWGNNELPSFQFNGYTIWINYPTLEERQEESLDEDWIYAVTHDEYECGDLIRSTVLSQINTFISKSIDFSRVNL